MTSNKKHINLSIILRFRDFDAEGDTISQHQSIIDEEGAVWWGWWKKEHEELNSDLLGEFAEVCSSGSGFVGLYDRSSNRFFSAKCEQVISGGKNFTPVRSMTPRYYGNEKLYAWFRFSSITEVSQSDFVDRFSGVPSSSEVTLFQVRNGNLVDKDDFFHYYHDPLETDSILHISDIHLGSDFGKFDERGPGLKRFIDRLKDDFSKSFSPKPSLVFFSGDITTRADVEAMRVGGLKFLIAICEALNLERHRLIMVPGNHDFPLSDVMPTDYSHENEFRGLLKDFYGEERGSAGMSVFKGKSGVDTAVLAINSVRLRSKDLKNFGYVEWGLYDDQLSKVIIDDNARKLAVLHHHLIPVPYEDELDSDYRYASASATIDAGSVISGLQTHSFDSVFHGHQHIPGITQICRGHHNGSDIMSLGEPLTVVSAGSCTSSRLTNYMRNNSFNHISFDTSGGMQVTAYEYTSAPGATKRHFTCKI